MRRLAQDLCARVAGLRRADDATFADMVDMACGGAGRRIICVRDGTGLRIEDMSNIAGNVPGAAIPPAPLTLSCYRPFEQLHVRYNGDVVLCHCDWKGEVVFGNVNEQSLPDIYDGAVARDYRERLARRDRGARLCSQCDFPGVLQ
jgi:radical SAM protein with 4Fe4S-binding SPASM domain